MNKMKSTAQESWTLSTFPEWGSWLNEEAEQERVVPDTLTMRWLGYTGIWLEPEGGTNVYIDFRRGTDK